MPSLEVLVFAPLIVFGAYLVFGMAGFGSTLIAVPLLVHLLPVKFVIPMVLLLDCVSAAGLGFKLREQVWKGEFKPLLPFLQTAPAGRAGLHLDSGHPLQGSAATFA